MLSLLQQTTDAIDVKCCLQHIIHSNYMQSNDHIPYSAGLGFPVSGGWRYINVETFNF